MANVLVVDDDDMVRRALVRHLRRTHTIQDVPNIEEAKRLLEAGGIEVVVSDLMMPGGTGLDLFLWVKEHQSALADRFMICSGGGPQEVLDDIQESGVPFYTKPVDVRTLLEAIQKLVIPSEPRSPSNPP